MPGKQREKPFIPLKGQKHHGRFATPYPTTFGRVDPSECTHSQFLDLDFPHTGICLDCGSVITLGDAAGTDRMYVTVDAEVAGILKTRGHPGNPKPAVLSDNDLDEARELMHMAQSLNGHQGHFDDAYMQRRETLNKKYR